LARPGGNVTGVTCVTTELSPKRVALPREAVPGLNKRPTRDTPGTAPRGRATRFGLSSVVTHVTPVTLPPGRARLETKVLDWPRATGRTSSSSTWPASATLHSTTCYCSSP